MACHRTENIIRYLCQQLLLIWLCCSSPHLSAEELSSPVLKYLKPTTLQHLNSGLSPIDCVYVINLDSRPEKWERVDALLRHHKVYANRFSGVKGLKIPIKTRKALCGNYPIRLSAGEFGCLLSHLSVIKDAYDRGFNCVWICEDDIIIFDKMKTLRRHLRKLTQIDPQWDIFYTDVDSKDSQGNPIPSLDADFRPDTHHHDLSYYREKKAVSHHLMQIHQRFGLYSYLLSRSGMQKILDYYKTMHLWTALDIDIHYVPDIREYSTTYDSISIWFESPFSDVVHSQRSN